MSINTGQYDLLDQLAEDFACRFRRGEHPALKEYTDRYPELASEIHQLFPALIKVEQAEDIRRAGEDDDWDSAATTPPLSHVGDYRILREVGRGGMGVVYEAEQVSLARRVALKVLPGHVASDPKALRRFRREAKAAAGLHHTNIVPVFEVGRDGDVAFYAMQFIQGQGLDQVIDELRRHRHPRKFDGLGPAAPEAPAISTAHPKTVGGEPLGNRTCALGPVAELIVSGRLATEGIGLTATDPPKSNGFARIAQRDRHETSNDRPSIGEENHPVAQARTDLSNSAMLPGGTHVSELDNSSRRLPFYRSVALIGRQAALGLAYAHARGIVHRDIKPSNLLLDSAGVVWITDFGLAKSEDDGLTGTGDILGTLRYMAPERFRGEGDARVDTYALGLTLYEFLTLQPAYDLSDRLKLIEQIQTDEPARPRSLDGRIPADLETIVLKAIDKDATRRYPTAEAMAEDLRRFLADEPIQARRTTASEHTWRWCRRNPSLAAALAAMVLILVGGTIASSLVAIRFQALAGEREAARVDAVRANQAERWERYRANMAAAASALQLKNVDTARRLLELTPTEHRNWEWRHIAAQLDTARGVYRGHIGPVHAVAISPDGRHVASCSKSESLRLWDTQTGRSLTLVQTSNDEAYEQVGRANKVSRQVLFTPDGQRVVSAGSDRLIRVWDVATGRGIHALRGHTDAICAIDITRDGTRIASGSWDKTVRLWDAQTGTCSAVLRGHSDIAHAVAFSPDGRRLASAGWDSVVRIWEVETGAAVASLRAHTAVVRSLAFSPDSGRLATGADFPDNTVRLWDAATGTPLAVMAGHENMVGSLAFNPDGMLLATASIDQTVRLWEGTTGRPMSVLKGHADWVNAVAFSPDGRRIVSASSDLTLRMWDAADGQPRAVLRGHEGSVWDLAYTADGALIASASEDRTVRLWDADLIERDGVFRGHEKYLYDIAFSPDGTRMATAAWDHTVRFWDPIDGRQAGLLRHDSSKGGKSAALRFDDAYIVALAYSPNGRTLATVTRDNRVYLWDVRSGEPRRVLDVPTDDWAMHPRAAFDPTGRLLATGGADALVRLWDVATGEQVATLRGHEGCVSDVVFSPDGAFLLSAGADRTIRLWDTATRKLVAVLTGHADMIHRLAYNPDGRLVASASQDHTVRLWDAQTHRQRAVLAHGSVIYGLAFTPDGTRLATACADNTIRLWDIATGTEVAELRGHEAYVHALAFSPDGTRLASASGDNTARVWDSLPIQARSTAIE
jgi:WD40 repeat protein/serine/threonine protein kinase